MQNFFANAPGFVVVEYSTALVLFIVYAWWKFSRRGYLFSPYSIPLWTYAFMLFVIGPLSYNDEAWVVLSQVGISPMLPGMNLSMLINLFGFIIIVSVLWFVEARAKTPRPPFFRARPRISLASIQALSVFGIVLFAVCLISVRTLPVFGNRTVFDSYESLRPVYNFANFIVLFSTSALVFFMVKRRSTLNTMLILAGLVCMFLTGGRTSLLSVVELIAIVVVYSRLRPRLRLATISIVAALVGVALLGLSIASIRSTPGSAALGGPLDSALYGNTFSDLRDGGFVAEGWLTRWSGTFLGGKTYLAGLISFLPSSVSDFRTEWSWGYFTTTSLWGYPNHYGFRGGWSLESYMNFGFFGVVLFALAIGWILGRLEGMFFHGFLSTSAPGDFAADYSGGWIAYSVFTVLIASSATYNIYTLIGCLAFIYVFTVIRDAFVRNAGNSLDSGLRV